MPSPRSAKEICAEEPKGIACKVATRREQRRKNRDEAYGITPAPKPPPKKPPPKKPKRPTKPATERRKYLEEKIREAEGSNES